MQGCINKGIISREKYVIVPHHSVLSGHIQSVQFWTPLYRKGEDRVESTQRRAMRMMTRLEALPYEGRLRDLGLFSLHKRRLREDLTTT